MAGAQAAARRVAFFGGSFDPPHLGHLAVARAARVALCLDTVLFAPVGSQPLKPDGSTAGFEDRVAMTQLAIAGERGFAVSRMDAPDPAGQPNYTLDTLRRLHADMPDAELFCIMGADSFVSLRRWRGAGEIPFTASLVIASRPGQSLDDLAAGLPQGVQLASREASPCADCERADTRIVLRTYTVRDAAGRTGPFHVLPDLDVEISASVIRAQLRSGEADTAVPALLPAAVARYIREHGLYQ